MFIENFKKQFKLCENCFRTKNKVAITILTKLGCDYPNPEAVESLRNLIKLKQFQGILGGRPN